MPRNATFRGPVETTPNPFGEAIGGDQLMPGGGILDQTDFPSADAVTITVGTPGGVVSGTSLPVSSAAPQSPLAVNIPRGAVFYTNDGLKFALVTTEVPIAGVTALTVRALGEIIAAGTSMRYNGRSQVMVPRGTPLGRTQAESDAGAPYGLAVDGDVDIFLLAFTVDDARKIADCELYRAQRIVYENFLPASYQALSNSMKALFRAKYQMMRAQAN